MPSFSTTSDPRTEIHYEDVGHGQPVVFIHGWPLSHRMWEGQVNALVAAGYRCVAYDRRGFGESGRPVEGYDYDTFASDLNDLIHTLALKDLVLVGFSMGGGEVVRYLARYGAEGRVARAILVAAVPPFLLKTADNPGGVDRSVFDGMLDAVKADRIGFLQQFMTDFYNLDVKETRPTDDAVLYAKSIAWLASPLATQQCITAFGTTDFRVDLVTVTVPTLIVHGDADRIVPIEVSGALAAAQIPGSRLEVLAGAPHGLTATHGPQLTALMLDFLRAQHQPPGA
jgi:non-heme chloroperoxidase